MMILIILYGVQHAEGYPTPLLAANCEQPRERRGRRGTFPCLYSRVSSSGLLRVIHSVKRFLMHRSRFYSTFGVRKCISLAHGYLHAVKHR